MKLALMLNVIDPAIGGVLIMGDRGCARAPNHLSHPSSGVLSSLRVAGSPSRGDPPRDSSWSRALVALALAPPSPFFPAPAALFRSPLAAQDGEVDGRARPGGPAPQGAPFQKWARPLARSWEAREW